MFKLLEIYRFYVKFPSVIPLRNVVLNGTIKPHGGNGVIFNRLAGGKFRRIFGIFISYV